MTQIDWRPALRLAWLACLQLAAATLSAAADGNELPNLAPRRAKDEITLVEIALECEGTLRVPGKDEPRKLPMQVTARQKYHERLLEGDPAGGQPLRGLRRYESADATIRIDKGSQTPTLRPQRRTIAVMLETERATLYCPQGLLTRDELDLLELPGASLAVEWLLPGHPVEVGQSWEHGADFLALWLGLDAVSSTDVKSTLTAIEGTTAKIELAGHVEGASDGIASQIRLKGKYDFDLSAGRVNWVALLINEERAIGHVGPGLEATTRLQMRLTPLASDPALSAIAAADVPQADPTNTALVWELPSAGFRFQHDRRWHVIDEQSQFVVLRLLERGELLAQCQVAALAKVGPGEHGSLADFQSHVERALGKDFAQFVEAGQEARPSGAVLYRVVAAGTSHDIPIEWRYYLVADPTGRRLVLGFTVEQELGPRLADADRQIVDSVELLEVRVDTAAQPTPARK